MLVIIGPAGPFMYPDQISRYRTPEYSWTSDRPQKQASAKADLSTFGSGVLAIS